MKRNKENNKPAGTTPVRKSHRPPFKAQLIKLIDAEIAKRVEAEQNQLARQNSFGNIAIVIQEDSLLRRFFEMMDINETGVLSAQNFNFKLLRSLQEHALIGIFEDALRHGQDLSLKDMQGILEQKGVLETAKERLECFL